MKLSVAMTEAIQHAAAVDRCLVRWPGGFWTYVGCPVARISHVRGESWEIPEWYIEMGTIKALINRKIISVVYTDRKFGFPTRVCLTDDYLD